MVAAGEDEDELWRLHWLSASRYPSTSSRSASSVWNPTRVGARRMEPQPAVFIAVLKCCHVPYQVPLAMIDKAAEVVGVPNLLLVEHRRHHAGQPAVWFCPDAEAWLVLGEVGRCRQARLLRTGEASECIDYFGWARLG